MEKNHNLKSSPVNPPKSENVTHTPHDHNIIIIITTRIHPEDKKSGTEKHKKDDGGRWHAFPRPDRG